MRDVNGARKDTYAIIPESFVGASPNRARSRGHVDVCGVVIGAPAVLHALGDPTPACLADGVSRAGVLACLRIHVGMVLSPFGGHSVFGYSRGSRHAADPTKILDILVMFFGDTCLGRNA